MAAWGATRRGQRRASHRSCPGAGLCGTRRRSVRHDAVHAHHHHGDRGAQPESDHGLRRHGELRPRRLSRHRRLRRRHLGQGRHRLRLRAMAGRDRGVGAVRAGGRRAMPAHPRRLFHHDHARLRADDLLRRQRARSLRRRRWSDHLPPQPVRRFRSQQRDGVLLSVFRACCWRAFIWSGASSIRASVW